MVEKLVEASNAGFRSKLWNGHKKSKAKQEFTAEQSKISGVTNPTIRLLLALSSSCNDLKDAAKILVLVSLRFGHISPQFTCSLNSCSTKDLSIMATPADALQSELPLRSN